MKLTAIMMVRNEASILAVNLAYHSALGVDEFWIVDNGSSDGTTDVLATTDRSQGNIRWRSEPGLLHLGEAKTSIAAEATKAGADWILPIDADEFWWSDNGALRSNLAEATSLGAFICGVNNFVQRRSVRTDRPESLSTMIYRAEPIGTMESARELVETGAIGFVEMVYPPKQILRASGDLIIDIGNHAARNLAGAIGHTSTIQVLHAPIRARSILAKRAEQGRRSAAVNPNPNTSWHLRRWARLAEEGTLDDDWSANSQRFGRLNVSGVHRRLIRDLRLRSAIAPFLEDVH
jgi:hypothetical protein